MQSFIQRVELAINDLKNGKPIILTDNPNRENEADLIYPAESITPSIMNFIIRHSSGIVCLSILEEQMKKLHLSYMVSPNENTSLRSTPFTVSIDAKEGVTTGVSASDRVKTVLTAIKEEVSPDELYRPGHIFPLCARPGLVLERGGHTEGAIEIAQLAGFKPAAILCEMMNADGTMMRGQALQDFALQHELNILSIEDLIHYRLRFEDQIADMVQTSVQLEKYGVFQLMAFKEKITHREHIVLEKYVSSQKETLVRIHSACTTGDIFASERCDCFPQLHYSLDKISREGGILIYLNQEGRGVGLFNKIKAYALQDQGFDTIDANKMLGLPVDSRDYAIAANVLRNKNINSVRLLTNNPKKLADLAKYGIPEVKSESLPSFCNSHNIKYLQTKKNKFNHALSDEIFKFKIP